MRNLPPRSTEEIAPAALERRRAHLEGSAVSNRIGTVSTWSVSNTHADDGSFVGRRQVSKHRQTRLRDVPVRRPRKCDVLGPAYRKNGGARSSSLRTQRLEISFPRSSRRWG